MSQIRIFDSQAATLRIGKRAAIFRQCTPTPCAISTYYFWVIENCLHILLSRSGSKSVGNGFGGGLGMPASTSLLIILAIVGIVALAACVWGWNTYKKKKHRAIFRKAVSLKNYGDYEKDYDTARVALSRDWDVVEIIHDLSTYSLGPAGLPEEITHEQAFEVVRQIKAARDNPLAVIIHTMGGYSLPTYMIAKALKQHRGKKVAFVPYAAMSGGTVIALAAEEIFMGEAACLGPIDSVFWGWPVSTLEHLIAQKNINSIDDNYVMLAHIASVFANDAVPRAQRHIHEKHAPNVARDLISGGRYHGDTISLEEARDIGINASPKCRKEVFALVDAKLRMVALEREEAIRRLFNMPTGRRVDRTQIWRAFNRMRPYERFLPSK